MNKGSQIVGICITIVVAALGGFIVGKIVAMLGRKKLAYDDVDEFEL